MRSAAVVGTLGAGLLPEEAIPYLGLLPLFLGLRAAWKLWLECRDNAAGVEARSETQDTEPEGITHLQFAAAANGGPPLVAKGKCSHVDGLVDAAGSDGGQLWTRLRVGPLQYFAAVPRLHPTRQSVGATMATAASSAGIAAHPNHRSRPCLMISRSVS